MKTSFKLILLAVLVLLGTTAAYDIALQKEYRKQDYDKPFLNYDQLGFTGFDSVEIVAANLITVEIVQGKTFSVKKHIWLKNAKIEQRGKRLIVTFATDQRHYFGEYAKKSLIIQCPELRELKTDAKFVVNGKTVIAKRNKLANYDGGQVVVKGFDQDEFSLVANNANTVYLKENKFGHFSANIGSQDSTGSVINVDESNKFLSADIDLQNSSVLTLKDISTEKFKFKVSDSAQVNLSGISLRLLSNKQ